MLVSLITPSLVPTEVVNPVGLALLNAVAPGPLTTMVPPSNVMFFVPAPVANEPVVKVYPFKSRVPLVSVVVLVIPTLDEVCGTKVPPDPLNVTGMSWVKPLKEKFLTPVEANVQAFVPELTSGKMLELYGFKKFADGVPITAIGNL